MVLGVTFDPFVLLSALLHISIVFNGQPFRVYRSIIRFSGAHLLKLLAGTRLLLHWFLGLLVTVLVSRDLLCIAVFFSVTALGGGRLVARDGYKSRRSGRRILIYGAEVQVSSCLRP